ncbi:uracil-DNA glycosylase [Stappia sp.]|uniref:uracil-DNA glycosylase n=1 Tax=Stappia sp. TaxID=1870903 RepID=UPI0032D8EB25
MSVSSEPERDCPLCPRLVAFREQHRAAEPDWHNAPVPTFASGPVRLLVVGLAPGLRGANKTGRPFTGDFAGDLLYETLVDFGFARGTYAARPDDGLRLVDTAITNAVRCVPPQNKPTGAEIRTCLPFLKATIAGYADLTAILALGRIAHEATLTALEQRKSRFPFGHGARHAPEGLPVLFDSYHCSRYNTNTGRLTRAMFRDVFAAVRAEIDKAG